MTWSLSCHVTTVSTRIVSDINGSNCVCGSDSRYVTTVNSGCGSGSDSKNSRSSGSCCGGGSVFDCPRVKPCALEFLRERRKESLYVCVSFLFFLCITLFHILLFFSLCNTSLHYILLEHSQYIYYLLSSLIPQYCPIGSL